MTNTNQPTSNQSNAPADLGYAGSLAELDEILSELESSDVDVDRLADQVSRAAELIAFCRGRIDAARITIDRVVAELDDTGEHAGDGDESSLD